MKYNLLQIGENMKDFMDKDFLLKSNIAQKLYHEYASKMPIIDYHCHISPKEIAEDIKFENITKLWLGGDHYKWRFMRSCGVEEKYITGNASDKEKFIAWASCLGKAIGNPLYHWSHLELRRYFDYQGILNKSTAEEVWNLCNDKLQNGNISAKQLIKDSNVNVICTTDDPIDSLEWHEMIKKDSSFKTKVLPAWRPDNAMNIEKASFAEYIEKLANISQIPISSFDDLCMALSKRMDFFEEHGCRVSDHGLDYVMFTPASLDEINQIFKNKLNGITISLEDELKYKTAFMLNMGKECSKRNWVMQLHYGCKRNNNTVMFDSIGPDTGYDCINDHTPSAKLADFLNELNNSNNLPKTILYSLNPADNAAIGTIIGCFQNSEAIGKIQHGSAWWFNDHQNGMISQISSLASLGNLSGFVGMLTDSRSFLSYTRHEYFRRILCNYIGDMIENGEFPADFETLKEIIEDISYNNAYRYFRFE